MLSRSAGEAALEVGEQLVELAAAAGLQALGQLLGVGRQHAPPADGIVERVLQALGAEDEMFRKERPDRAEVVEERDVARGLGTRAGGGGALAAALSGLRRDARRGVRRLRGARTRRRALRRPPGCGLLVPAPFFAAGFFTAAFLAGARFFAGAFSAAGFFGCGIVRVLRQSAARSHSSSAFCACRRFSAWSQIR